MIRAILACDGNKGIGKNNSLPWHHKDDMRFFKMATIGHGKNTVVMGRKTKESIPNFPLQKRKNLVISKGKESDFSSIEEFEIWLKTPKQDDEDDIFIIGGASIFHQVFERGIPEEIYITILDNEYDCDTFIDFDIIEKNYKLEDSRKIEDYTFQVWERK